MRSPARELRTVAAALCLLANEEKGRPRRRFLLAARVLRQEAKAIEGRATARATQAREDRDGPRDS